jgi:hypothetical protein
MVAGKLRAGTVDDLTYRSTRKKSELQDVGATSEAEDGVLKTGEECLYLSKLTGTYTS